MLLALLGLLNRTSSYLELIAEKWLSICRIVGLGYAFPRKHLFLSLHRVDLVKFAVKIRPKDAEFLQ